MEHHEKSPSTLFQRIAIHFGIPDPTGQLSFTYLAEGAANVIWGIQFTNSNVSSVSDMYVLRMRKNLPFTISSADTVRHFSERIAPLFLFDPSLLLPLNLCKLSPSVVQGLNDQLHALEDAEVRSEKRRGIYHPTFEDEPYAILMKNLSYGAGTAIEFKPKWLTQSPSAPRDAQRCRTCALNAMRRSKGVAQGRGDSGFCPFDSLSSNEAILGNALRQLWPDKETLQDFATAFRSRVQPALRQMQQLQREHAQVGLEDFEDPEGKDFSIAMALRDCSVFCTVVVSHDVQIPLVKVLDLDMKDAGGGKLAKWASMEQELLSGGWYTAEKSVDVQCAMSFQ